MLTTKIVVIAALSLSIATTLYHQTNRPQDSEEPVLDPTVYRYPWRGECDAVETAANRIPTPEGCERGIAEPNSFADWLRHLPLKEGRPPVYCYDGSLKWNQDAHHAVVDIDVGRSNLQQCADAVMRLRAEYLYSFERFDEIKFNFTSGDPARYEDWIQGLRPVVRGSRVTWAGSGRKGNTYESFRKYLNIVFSYAGTYSLSLELDRVEDINDMRIGDAFIQGGFPGHAVLVVDMAEHKETGAKVFLLAQSYMPAQEIHILRNPNDEDLSPWYELDFGDRLYTPEWVFELSDLRRVE